MSTVVNLRLARKQKARVEKERLAARNRAIHGRSKAEKARDRLEVETTAAFLESHRIEPPDRDGKA
jgi:hypothetical protein